MITVLGLLAFLFLPLIGISTWRIDAVRRAPIGARVAIAGAAGALIVAGVMMLLSILHIDWSRTSLLIALIPIVIVSTRRLRPVVVSVPRPRWTTVAIAVFVVLTAYGVSTARETSSDLYYFWGSKAVRFVRDGGMKLSFLRDPSSYSLHPDYPPYLSLIYAWSETVGQHFSFWAAILMMPLILMAIAAIVGAFSGDRAGTLLTVATMAQAMAITCSAGGADAPLLLFESLTIAAILFIDDEKSQVILAAIGAAGATAMKVEGATFAIAVAIALIVVRRDARRALLIATPSAVLFVGWYVFTQVTGASETYSLIGRFPFRAVMVPRVIALLPKQAAYNLWYLSWLVPVALIALGNIRRAALPLAIALLTISATIFFYSRGEDPSWWIENSASRVLMTPVLALDFAAIAALRPREAFVEY